MHRPSILGVWLSLVCSFQSSIIGFASFPISFAFWALTLISFFSKFRVIQRISSVISHVQFSVFKQRTVHSNFREHVSLITQTSSPCNRTFPDSKPPPSEHRLSLIRNAQWPIMWGRGLLWKLGLISAQGPQAHSLGASPLSRAPLLTLGVGLSARSNLSL